MNNFTIDFFEFSFLVEACIPPGPIARSSFWDSVIDKYYYQMTHTERKHLFEWTSRNLWFKPEENEQCLMFKLRFDPGNQYQVTTKEGKVIDAFKVNQNYHIGINRWISEDNIVSVKPNSNL